MGVRVSDTMQHEAKRETTLPSTARVAARVGALAILPSNAYIGAIEFRPNDLASPQNSVPD
jgi:hypothetical protein